MKAQQYKDAVQAYSDAERLKADSATAVKLHNALRLANQPKSEAPLERWLERRPNDAAVRMVLAQYFMNSNRGNEAIAEYETFVKAGGGNPVALNNLAWLYDTHGRKRPRRPPVRPMSSRRRIRLSQTRTGDPAA